MSGEGLEFDWDEANLSHIALHGLGAHQVEESLRSNTIRLKVEIRDGEMRERVLGSTREGMLLEVVTTERREIIRVVTAFQASRLLRQYWKSQRR